MKKRSGICALLIAVLLTGCAHYSARDGYNRIIPQSESSTLTKLSEIQERENPSPPTEKEIIEEKQALIEDLQQLIISDGKKYDSLNDEMEHTRQLYSKLIERYRALENTHLRILEQKSGLEQENLQMKQENDSLVRQINEYDEAKRQKERMLLEKQQKEQKALCTIEPLEELVYPKRYLNRQTAPLSTPQDVPVSVSLIPLGETEIPDESIPVLANSLPEAEITLLTGSRSNVYRVVKTLNRSSVLTESGAILTDYPAEPLASGARLTISDGRKVKVVLTDIKDSSVIDAIVSQTGIEQTLEEQTPSQIEIIHQDLADTRGDEAVLYGASLMQPGNGDWSAFSPVEYRQREIAWPLSEEIQEQGFFDAYRMTRYSADCNAGNLYRNGEVAERTDFLFFRRILPVDTAVESVGVLSSAPVQRFGLLAEFLIP